MPKPENLRVTDPVVIKEIQRQGLNVNDVDFIQDYGPCVKGVSSPYMKRYKHKSGRQFAVFSGLPMVNYAGKWVSPLWRNTGPQSYESDINQFIARVDTEEIEIETINEQPKGGQVGDKVKWKPELWVGNTLISTGNSRILAIDPVNTAYIRNTIEWDYSGICKRRLRLIEGRIRERWVFESNPNQDIKIKHNLVGSGVILGTAHDKRGLPIPVTVIEDEEIVYTSDLTDDLFPIEIGASATYYPDTGSEGANTSVDGRVAHIDVDVSWDTIQGAVGNNADNADDYLHSGWQGQVGEPNYKHLWRSIAVFDISPIAGSTISVTTFSGYGFAKIDEGSNSPTANVFSASPALATVALVAGDYDSLGTSAYCDTAITYAGFNVGTPGSINDWVLNADPGIIAVQAAVDGDGLVKIGLREATFDAPDNPPTWGNSEYTYIILWSTDKGAGYKPKLVVTYTLGWGGKYCGVSVAKFDGVTPGKIDGV